MQMKLLMIGSATRTLRAQEVLLSGGISARIKRLNNSTDGCVRALQIEDGQVSRAVTMLAKAGIPVRNVEDGKT